MGEQLLARCYETESKNVQAWAARGQHSNEAKPLEGLRISPGWERKGQVAPRERSLGKVEGWVLCGVKRTLAGLEWAV